MELLIKDFVHDGQGFTAAREAVESMKSSSWSLIEATVMQVFGVWLLLHALWIGEAQAMVWLSSATTLPVIRLGPMRNFSLARVHRPLSLLRNTQGGAE